MVNQASAAPAASKATIAAPTPTPTCRMAKLVRQITKATTATATKTKPGVFAVRVALSMGSVASSPMDLLRCHSLYQRSNEFPGFTSEKTALQVAALKNRFVVAAGWQH